MKDAGFDRPPGVTVANWDAPKELNHLHNAICYAAAGGARNKDIAASLHCTAQTVSNVINSEIGKLQIKRYQMMMFGRDAKKRYESILPVAIDTAEEIMTSPQNKAETRARIAKDFMDRATGKPTQPIDVGGSAVRSLIELLERGTQAPPVPGSQAIDVTPGDDVVVDDTKNPNEVENDDIRENPNFAPDPVDDWCNENL